MLIMQVPKEQIGMVRLQENNIYPIWSTIWWEQFYWLSTIWREQFYWLRRDDW